MVRWLVRVAASLAAAACLGAQGREAFSGSFKNPSIAYETSPLNDAATRLDQQLANGSKRLQFDAARGYLPSMLQALSIPIESQVAVFSQTSLQAKLISAHHPRAVYFNDHVAVGWVPNADELEIAAQDPVQGVVFYRLEQKQSQTPRLERSRECLRCHVAWETLAVPGFLVLSTGPDDAAGYATGGAVDGRDEIGTRWGKWYITGPQIPKAGLGTAITSAPWLANAFDARTYLSPHSDVVALMVLEHQARAINLITYLGWETRIGASDARLDSIVDSFVDYFTFADEAPLPGRYAGSSGFAATFQAAGRRDGRGRSLRELDLETRLMKYRCSYMIDSAAFDALPARARQKVAARMTTVLRDRDPAALEILTSSKPDLFK
ncbi:MAG TPA: hypothetical protein VN654_13315 [Vicinamibacterales bacterium]|nr:hypothetical protein [Vicinamibacterales bacterium]